MIDAAIFFANPAPGMTIKTRNRLIVLFIFAFPFMVLFGFLASQIIAPLAPIQPLPNPNGYDDFVKAAQMVSTNSWNYDKMNEEQLRETTESNAAALALARAGLSNECRVPLQFTQAYNKNHISDLAGVKRLAQAFVAEGRLAEMENRPNDAAKSYLDVIHLGNESAHGGTLIDELVGIAVESIGRSPLQKLLPQLNAKSCRETAEALTILDSQQQTWDEVMQQENNWSHRFFPGWRQELSRLMEHNSLEKAFQTVQKKYQAEQTKTRQLIIALAARAYELDKGKPPASLADLVPDYLKAIPEDPLTGTNMIYSPK
jgi:hypothetical protein